MKAIDNSFSFKKVVGIEYFDFEDDFVEGNLRCIPMIVRFKMDRVGIKLKLADWNRFSHDERVSLAIKPCDTPADIAQFHDFLSGLVQGYTGKQPTQIAVDTDPAWKIANAVPDMVAAKAAEFGWEVNKPLWDSLSDLQRFALVKLCRPGHENLNFPKAMKEFKLVKTNDQE